MTHYGSQSVAQVAKDLGIAEESLRRWAIQAEIDRGGKPRPTNEEREELRRLRKENKSLLGEREMLEKPWDGVWRAPYSEPDSRSGQDGHMESSA